MATINEQLAAATDGADNMDGVWEAARGLLSAIESRLLRCGSTDQPLSHVLAAVSATADLAKQAEATSGPSVSPTLSPPGVQHGDLS